MHKKAAVRIVLFLFVLAVSPLLAQNSIEDLRELSIEELMNQQVVSSTQTYVRLPQAPSSVFVVTGEQIRKWGIRRLSELVERLVPGAISAEDVDDMILAFRGITADNNLKVLLLLNGHEYNTQWNDGPSSEVELGLLDDIKKVEVLIGPHSALYGSGALIGVINMITKSGADFRGLRVSANAGTGDFRRGDLIFGKQISENLNYFISAGGLAADGYNNPNNPALGISEFPPSWRFFGNVNYKDFIFQTRYTRSSRAFYVNAATPTNTNPWTNRDTFFAEGRRSFHLSDQLRWDLDFSFDTIQTQRHDFRTDLKLRAVGEDRYTAKLTSFYSGWNRNNLVLGIEYRRDEFGPDWSGDNFSFDALTPPSDLFAVRNFTPYGRNVYALFGQDSIEINQRLSLLLGFRFNRIEAPLIREPNLFSPRLALVYTPTPKTVLKAMVTSGTSRVINAVNTSPDAIHLGNPTILDIDKPEKMHSFELAASYQPKPSLDFSFNVFYNSLRDIFGIDPARPRIGGVGFGYLISAGRIDYLGFEGIVSANLTGRLFVRAMHQHVQLGSVVNDPFGFLTTPEGDHLNNYPENVTKFLADYRLKRNVSLNLNTNLVWDNYGFTRNPALHFTSFLDRHTFHNGFYTLLNANVVWNLNAENELIFSGCNLFNYQKQIAPYHFNRANIASRVFLAERNFNVNISHHF